MLATSLAALAYQLAAPPGLGCCARATSPHMEARLNNYVLPGPMTLLGNQVMIKARKVDDKTTGGLFVPTADTEKPKEGMVVLAGPGKHNPETGELIDCPVKEGDLVVMSNFVGETVEYNGESHIFCDADSLLGSFADNALAIGNFKPLKDLVMVQASEQETETTTGIALAGIEEEEGNSGTVLAVGPGRYALNGKLVEPTLKSGDSVMYVRRAGQDVTIEGKSFTIVPEEDCIVKW